MDNKNKGNDESGWEYFEDVEDANGNEIQLFFNSSTNVFKTIGIGGEFRYFQMVKSLSVINTLPSTKHRILKYCLGNVPFAEDVTEKDVFLEGSLIQEIKI